MSVSLIEINENRALAQEHSALSVPRTFINGNLTADGLEPEELFIESLLAGKKALGVPKPASMTGPRSLDLVILGGGPAGLTAAIYAKRSGLDTVVIERASLGGQIALTPAVENYPGFPRIAGLALVELMAKQAVEYADVFEGVNIESLKAEDGVFTIDTSMGTFRCRAVILATGASHRNLGAKGEERLKGRGVSYCSTCDGYAFKDGRSVVVVGGGNSALTDALYLESIGAKVTLVHRGREFRAERRLQDSLNERGIEVRFESIVREITGKAGVEAVVIENTATGKTDTLQTEGVFIAVGYDPNTEAARALGVELDSAGYIKTDIRQRTSLPGVYAAGDVTGGVKQITVAVGQGSVAAISAFEDITHSRLHGPLTVES